MGEALARLRRERDLTGVEVAKRSGVSQGQISKIENSRVTPTPADVRKLATALELPSTEATDLVERARSMHTVAVRERSGRRRGAHRTAPAPAPQIHQEDLFQLEARVRSVRAFEPVLVPGLLQTSEYARRVLNRYFGVYLGDDQRVWPDTAAMVGTRLQRQERLYDTTKKFDFIILEQVFEYRFGRASWPVTMAAQLQRIEAACDLPNVSIRVIPRDTDLPFPPLAMFQVFDDEAVLVESTIGFLYRDQSNIDMYSRVFERYREVSTEDVLPIIKRYKAEYLEASAQVARFESDQSAPGHSDQ
ncbi:hypothetical protein BCD48_20355 [Pseudofrankia sp. BMG5.36]|nr:hypothetical protein BCD48_20355 [Pseudofrankia sp. BMG5.36]